MRPFDALISAFAKTTGLPLQVAADDSCTLEYDELLITLQYRQEQDDVVLFAPVMTPNEGEVLPAGVLRKAIYAAGCNLGMGHEPRGGVTALQVGRAELPKGEKFTITATPLTSVGTRGKAIGGFMV